MLNNKTLFVCAIVLFCLIFERCMILVRFVHLFLSVFQQVVSRTGVMATARAPLFRASVGRV